LSSYDATQNLWNNRENGYISKWCRDRRRWHRHIDFTETATDALFE